MSSRVSRLVQIRQRRDKANDKSEASLESAVNIDTLKDKNDEDETEVPTGAEEAKKEAAEQANEDLGERDLNKIDQNEQDKLYRDIYEQTGVFETSESAPKAAVSYNSDLKKDLAQLYGRAHHGTERAINAIIQKKYQESMIQ